MKYPRYFPYQDRDVAFRAIQFASGLPGNHFPHEPMGKRAHASFEDGLNNKQANMAASVIIFIKLYFYYQDVRQTLKFVIPANAGIQFFQWVTGFPPTRE
jgi:hypothetical protein